MKTDGLVPSGCGNRAGVYNNIILFIIFCLNSYLKITAGRLNLKQLFQLFDRFVRGLSVGWLIWSFGAREVPMFFDLEISNFRQN